MIPTIDIGGRWAPTHYVRRASADTAAEVAALRSLAHGLGPHEGILIYPEGTRFTTAKLARAQAIIAERQPEIAPLASRLRHVLPPRLGGPLALLDEARGRRRRLLRARGVRRIRPRLRHLERPPGREDDPHPLLALCSGGDPAGRRGARRVAVRALAGDRRLGGRAAAARARGGRGLLVRRSGVGPRIPGIRAGDETRNACPTDSRPRSPGADAGPAATLPGPGARNARAGSHAAGRAADRAAGPGAPHARARADIGSGP